VKRSGLATIILLVFLSLVLAACSPSLVGKWVPEDEPKNAIEFLQDGTVNVYRSDEIFGTGAYEIDGDKITMNITGQSTTSTFKIEGNKLTLTGTNTDGSTYTTVFIRQ